MYKKIKNNKQVHKLKSALVKTAGVLIRSRQSPDVLLGDLFEDVQTSGVYADGKTFIDLIPRGRARAIKEEYELVRKDPNFNLHEFVNRHFYEFAPHNNRDPFVGDSSRSVSQHIQALWHELERRNRKDRGSLLMLPYSYIVPGGRFREQFYWDSYFIMLGLASDDRWDVIEGMIKNHAYMIRKWGFIPTANRSYFLSRSQPPFYALMVKLLARNRSRVLVHAEHLPYMLAEYKFWMKGKRKLIKTEHKSSQRIVQLPSNVYMNRYFDNAAKPRPESLLQDIETAYSSTRPDKDRIYLHLRAAAESGWDFSSRWFLDPHDIRTIHTADIIPVDLNCLLYVLEQTIAESYRSIKNSLFAKKFERLASRRREAIQAYCWNEQEGFFDDYNFHLQQHTGRVTLAGVFTLYTGVATKEQAASMADRLKKDFLRQGGLVTTLTKNGQQWDAPNGWAPLQWVAIRGLRAYGYNELADEIKKRWIAVNLSVYKTHHKLVEKYNVEAGDSLGGGGEYPLQDGFGWTNGVLAALLSEDLFVD